MAPPLFKVKKNEEYRFSLVQEVVQRLMSQPALQGRTFYNYLFSFISDDNRMVTYSLDRDVLANLGPEKAIDELLKR